VCLLAAAKHASVPAVQGSCSNVASGCQMRCREGEVDILSGAPLSWSCAAAAASVDGLCSTAGCGSARAGLLSSKVRSRKGQHKSRACWDGCLLSNAQETASSLLALPCQRQ
jgi:hypothetical protein